MRRFSTNRWWTFFLTLTVLLASGTALPTAVRATPDPTPINIEDGGSLGGGAPEGDPDGPAGPTKKAPGSGTLSPGGSSLKATAGDGGRAGWSVWMWRLHVVLLSLKIRYIR
jgi:hypothetical protein